MEIMVASVIFVMVAVSLLSLFNYVLKINRRSEALRQASQGMRNFIEFVVKEVRNGQIDYYVANAATVPAFSGTSPCGPPSGGVGNNTYALQENRLGIINTDNVQECFYYGNAGGNYIGAGKFSSSTGASTLVLEKSGVSGAQILNPSNMKVDNLMFLIRPLCDPYTPNCAGYGGGYPKIQPFVTIIIKFTVKLPTGEQVPIYYQTSVSSNKYDIPNSP